jgi:hypothetical protein
VREYLSEGEQAGPAPRVEGPARCLASVLLRGLLDAHAAGVCVVLWQLNIAKWVARLGEDCPVFGEVVTLPRVAPLRTTIPGLAWKVR